MPLPNMWCRFRAIYKMELRLLCWNWGYPTLFVATAALLVFTGMRLGMGTGAAVLESDVGRVSIGLLSLASLFVTGASTSRGERVRFQPLEGAYALGPEQFLAKWLAVWTALMGFLVIPVTMAIIQGPARSVWGSLPGYVAEFAITMAFTTSAVAWLVDWLGMRRWVYPLVAAAWLSFTMVQRMMGRVSLHLGGLGLLDFMRLSQPTYTEIWGDPLYGRLSLWFELFYLGLSLFFISMALWRYQVTRTHRRPIVAGGILTLAVAATLAGAVPYIHQVLYWNHLGQDARAFADQTLGSGTSPISAATAVQAYDLRVDVTDPEYLHVRGTVSIRNQSAEPRSDFILTLNHTLQVIKTDVKYERKGDMVVLHLSVPLKPGEVQAIAMEYEGKVWAIVDGVNPSLPYFTATDGVRLAPLAGWYPLAGIVGINPRGGSYSHAPASFKMRIEGPPGWAFATNLPIMANGKFEASASPWVFLAGSPRLVVETQQHVTLVAARDDLAAVRPWATEYSKAFESILPFFPNARVRGATLLVMDPGDGLLPSPDPVDGQLVLVAGRRTLTSVGHRFTPNVVVQSLTNAMWRLSGGWTNLPVQESIGSFLLAFVENNGAPAGISAAANLKGDALAQALAGLYEQQGSQAVAKVFSRLLQEPNAVSGLNTDQVRDWMRKAAQ